MTTAICLTPDRRYFGPAVCVAAQAIGHGIPEDTEVMIVCEEGDIWPDYDRLDAALRERIKIIRVSFAPLIGAAPATLNGSRAIYRRLVLDRVLPDHYQRFIAIDSDIAITREGLAALTNVDLHGYPLAAAIDMIFYMDFGGPLGQQFHDHRRSLGLLPHMPYFNNGVTVIDRLSWQREDLGARAISLIAADPARYTWFDQDALNVLLAGRFAALSPRYNFMGDFLLLDLEIEIAPIVYHFVNRPKPWESGFMGNPKFAQIFYRWFAKSPWAGFAAVPKDVWSPTKVNAEFRRRLLADLRGRHFADGWALARS